MADGGSGPFVHPDGRCESERSARAPGSGRSRMCSRERPSAADCNVCDHVFIENDVVVGDRVTIKWGVQLWDGVRLGDDVFVGPNATFTNDPFPRSKRQPSYSRHDGPRRRSIGANATILPGVTVGTWRDGRCRCRGDQRRPGACDRLRQPGAHPRIRRHHAATRNASRPGRPGRVGRWRSDTADPAGLGPPWRAWPLASSTICRSRRAGSSPCSASRRRVSAASTPTGYATRYCCASKVRCQWSSTTERRGKRSPLTTLELPCTSRPMVWATQYRFSANAVLGVLASHPYDSADYIRDYGEYLRERGSARCLNCRSSCPSSRRARPWSPCSVR